MSFNEDLAKQDRIKDLKFRLEKVRNQIADAVIAQCVGEYPFPDTRPLAEKVLALKAEIEALEKP